jgi:outer membrane protein assembly factor BamB
MILEDEVTYEVAVFVGIHGNVIALDRATGQELWRTELKGSDFVNLLVDGDVILASTYGAIFCLDAVTGTLLWRNDLPGQGWGIASIATSSGSTTSAGPARKRQQDQEAAAVSTTAVIASP